MASTSDSSDPPLGEDSAGTGLTQEAEIAGSAARRRGHAVIPSKAHLLGTLLTLVRLGPVLVLGVLILILSFAAPHFLSTANVQNVLIQSSVVAIIAIGELIVIVTGGIDLSAGAAMALATVVGALAFENWHVSSGFLVVLIMVAVGVAVGLTNAILFIWGRMPHPFIVTLATLAMASGVALTISNGQPLVGVPSLVNTLGNTYIGVIPVPAFVALGTAGIASLFMHHTQWGRWIYATGGNQEAARRVGIPVRHILGSVYVLSGLCAGIAAILTAGLEGGGDSGASPAQGSLLDAVAGVIIGGASLFGGRGTVANAVTGALTVGVIRNGLALMNISPFSEDIFVGATIAIAVELDVVRTLIENRVRTLRSLDAA